jgi:hypothetical protein
MDPTELSAGCSIRVVKGVFLGKTGVVLDQTNALDAAGKLLPPTRPGSGYFWAMLNLDDSTFAAHLYHDEIVLSASSVSVAATAEFEPLRGPTE